MPSAKTENCRRKSARFFAQLCLSRLRLKQLTPSRYNDVELRVFAQEEGAVPKW